MNYKVTISLLVNPTELNNVLQTVDLIKNRNTELQKLEVMPCNEPINGVASHMKTITRKGKAQSILHTDNRVVWKYNPETRRDTVDIAPTLKKIGLTQDELMNRAWREGSLELALKLSIIRKEVRAKEKKAGNQGNH